MTYHRAPPAWHAQVLPMIEKGMTLPQIAHDLGVTYTAVWHLCDRRGWKPVKCPYGRRSNHGLPRYFDNDLADFDAMGVSAMTSLGE